MPNGFIFSIVITIYIGYQWYSLYHKVTKKKLKNPYIIFLYAIASIVQILIIGYAAIKMKWI